MRVAILTFDGFNELDSFIALGLLNRLGADGWKAEITSPTTHITSMNGVTVQAGMSASRPSRASSSAPEHCAPISCLMGSSCSRSRIRPSSAIARV